MTRAIDLPKLYRGQINLWVEDSLTAQYLQEVWTDPSFLFLISGGKDGIGSLVSNATENGYGNIFGLVDRDFGTTNYRNWKDGDKDVRIFILPVFEMENYLLDAEALSGCDVNTSGKQPAEIQAIMHEKAKQLVWWMTCNDVIVRLRKAVLDNFMERPKWTDVGDLASCEKYILDSPWYQRLPSDVGNISKPATLHTMLQESQTLYHAQLASDDWMRGFAGKEMFRHTRSYVYHPPRSASTTILDADVAKSVGTWQYERGRVPKELLDLREALRKRVANT